MTGYFRFIGADGSLGYQQGRVYRLRIRQSDDRVTILSPRFCPYDSNELFYKNWKSSAQSEHWFFGLFKRGTK